MNIQTIAVIGAGTMGQGIAQVAAMAGFNTLLFDLQAVALEKALAQITQNLEKAVELGKMSAENKKETLARLNTVNDIATLQADCIIEAIVERLDVKRQLFAQLESINSPETILASNTSSISITQIANGLQNPERVVGMHFFNPAHLMKLVEVISGVATTPAVAEVTKQLVLKMGKTPVMAQDAPGFIVNRVARPFYTESLKILEENIASFEDIDRLVESVGFRMGPFRLMDMIGMDINFSVTSSLYAGFHQEPRFRPNRLQQQKVDAGHLGRKTGKGFYDYKKE